MSNNVQKDIQFVKDILPNYYRVKESAEKEGSIHCCSTGTNKGMNEPQWDRFNQLCRDRFGERLSEFYHHVNADHQDFTIFLK